MAITMFPSAANLGLEVAPLMSGSGTGIIMGAHYGGSRYFQTNTAGRIHGDVSEITEDGTFEYPCRVTVYVQRGMRPVLDVWTDADAKFSVEFLDMTETYVAMAWDHNGKYDPVAIANIKPDYMVPPREPVEYPWDPSMMPGMVSWMDPDYGVELLYPPPASAYAAAWTSRGGAGIKYTSPNNSTAVPMGVRDGHTVMKFYLDYKYFRNLDPVDTAKFGGMSSYWTMFVGYKNRNTDWQPVHSVVRPGGEAGHNLYLQSSSNTAGMVTGSVPGGNEMTNVTTTSTPVGQLFILYGSSSSTGGTDNGTRVQIDGGPMQSSTSGHINVMESSMKSLVIGSNRGETIFTDMDMVCMIAGCSPTAPSRGDVDKLVGWAAHKYGIAGKLPADHPWKESPPKLIF